MGESKVLPYFGNIRHNSAALDTMPKLWKRTNPTGQWETKLAWYSLGVTYLICFYALEQIFRIHDIRSTWPCQIFNVLASGAKFLPPSGYITVINCTFSFYTINDFGSFCRIMVQFELLKHKFSHKTSLICCCFQIQTRSKTMHNMSVHQLV